MSELAACGAPPTVSAKGGSASGGNVPFCTSLASVSPQTAISSHFETNPHKPEGTVKKARPHEEDSGGDNLHELPNRRGKETQFTNIHDNPLNATSVVLEGLGACLEERNLLKADFWLFSYIEFSVEAMKFLIGKKMEMSQIFKEDGTVIPITYVQAGPCVVTDVRTKEKDGYHAVQVGFGTARRTSKAQSARAQLHGPVAITREYRTEDLGKVQTGDTLTVEQFAQGDLVDVVGTSKGRGFSGVVKRHGFAGQSATHGTKDQIRKSGSIGAGGVQRVFKGMRMAGRMGGDRVTVKNLEIVSVDPQTHRLAIRGAVPGARNSLVLIKGRGERLHWSV